MSQMRLHRVFDEMRCNAKRNERRKIINKRNKQNSFLLAYFVLVIRHFTDGEIFHIGHFGLEAFLVALGVSPRFVGPHSVWLLDIAFPRNAKQCSRQRDNGQQRIRPARVEIQRDDPLIWPGMKGHVGFEQDPRAAHSHRDHLVAMVR